MKIRLFLYLSYLFYWLFFPILWPVKKIKQFNFQTRKVNRIREAELLANQTGKKAFVIQNGTKFIVSQRKDLRQLNTKKSKKLKGTGGFVEYRKAIVYEAVPNRK